MNNKLLALVATILSNQTADFDDDKLYPVLPIPPADPSSLPIKKYASVNNNAKHYGFKKQTK